MSKIFTFIFIITFNLFFTGTVYTQTDAERQLGAFAGEQGAGYGATADPRIVAANIIRVAMTIVGTLFVAYTVYAGYLIMTAAGSEDKITKAKDTLRTSIIGVIVTLSAYAITTFATNSLLRATKEEGFESGIYIDEGRRPPPSRDPLNTDFYQ